MDKKTLYMLITSGILVLVLLVVAYYKNQLAQQQNVVASALPDKTCTLQQSECRVRFANGQEVSFEISPRPIPLVSQLDLNVQVKGLDAKGVKVDFQGTTMNMGPNMVSLNSQSAGKFKGKGMLPVCVRNSMEWKAEVLVQTPDGTYSAPFIFVTSK